MTTRPKFPRIEPMTQDIEDALTNANAPTAGNPFTTVADAAGGGAGFVAVPEADRLVIDATPNPAGVAG